VAPVAFFPRESTASQERLKSKVNERVNPGDIDELEGVEERAGLEADASTHAKEDVFASSLIDGTGGCPELVLGIPNKVRDG